MSPRPQNNNGRKNTLDNMLSNYTKKQNWSKSLAWVKYLRGAGGGTHSQISQAAGIFFSRKKKIKKLAKF